MALKFRRGTTAQQSGSLAFGEPYVNTTLGTLVVGGQSGDIVLSTSGTGSTGNFGAISGSGLDITGNANIAGNVTVGGKLTIGDATSDTVNVVASLSSSLIPQTTNAFDLGSLTKIWRDLYISTGSIKFVDGSGTQVGTLTATSLNAGTQSIIALNDFSASQLTQNSALATISGSLISSASAAKTTNDAQDVSITNINSFSGSQLTQNSALATISGSLISTASNHEQRLGQIESKSGSFDGRFTALATISGSLISTASNHEQRIAANESVSSSYARTNSANTFTGNQIVSGSMTVTQDLVVLGSSSIQNITSSNLVIGAAYVTLNTNTPSSRYAGLRIIDSGSAGGSGSFLYDAVQDEFIFVHKGNGTNVTSSHFVLGPETYDNLGNETYLTTNKLPKGTGKEHLVDSNILDTGTVIALTTNSEVTGSLTVSSAVNASSILVNGFLGISTGADVNTVKIGRNTGGTSQRTVAIGYGSAGGAGSYNVAVGDQAGQSLAGSNNVVVGATTLNSTGNVSNNTIVGASSANTNAIGSTNTLIGYGHVLAATSATNTIIGASVSQSAALTGNIIIANGSGAIKFWYNGTDNILNNNSVVSGSLTVTGSIIGSIAATNGVVSGSSQVDLTATTNYASGILTRLQAVGVFSGSSQVQAGSITGDIALGTQTSGNYVATITAGTGVSSTGATTGEGIAHTISIGQAVATSDNVRFNSIGVGMAASATAGRIDAANDVVAFSTSDIRFKENITPIPNAIEKIRKISGNTYDWKADLKDVHGYEGNDVGVIAQEIEEVLPQLVQNRDNGYKAVKYDKLVALLIEGIKEQQQHIDNLTIQVEELKKQKGL